MGCIGSMLAGCLGSCAGGCCASAAGKGSLNNKGIAKKAFFGIDLFALFLILIFQSESTYSWFKWMPGVGQCSDEFDPIACWRKQSTIRVSFSVTIFFTLHLFLALIGLQKAAMFRLWVLKFMAIPVLFLIFLLLPLKFFDHYTNVAMVFSIFYLVLQMMILLDSGYVGNAMLMEMSRRDQMRDLTASGTRWKVLVVVLSLLLLAFAFTMTFLPAQMFHLTVSKVFIWVNFSLMLVLTVVSCLDMLPQGALLPACLTFAYTTYLTWAACMSNSEEDLEKYTVVPVRVFGFLFLSAALGSYVRDPTIIALGNGDDDVALSSDEGYAEAASGPGEEGGQRLPAVKWLSAVIFFLVHVLGSMYLVPLIIHPTTGVAVWSYATANWLCIALYAFHLVAPAVLEGRNFA